MADWQTGKLGCAALCLQWEAQQEPHVVDATDKLLRDSLLVVVEFDDAATPPFRALEELHVAGVGCLVMRHDSAV